MGISPITASVRYRVVEETQPYGRNGHSVTYHASEWLPLSGLAYPGPRQVGYNGDELYPRTDMEENASSVASSSFFGAARAAELKLGNARGCTQISNARTNSAVRGGRPRGRHKAVRSRQKDRDGNAELRSLSPYPRENDDETGDATVQRLGTSGDMRGVRNGSERHRQ